MGWEVTGQIVVENTKSGLVRAARVRCVCGGAGVWRESASGALRDAMCVFRRDNSF